MKRFILIPLILLLAALSHSQTTIAVIDFDARDISASEVATLTDRFRDELTKTNQYTVIERGKMEEVLREQGFQQSGCSSDECVVEVGQLIGVQQMVGGSIGKVGTIYTLSARIIDVESGTIINVTNYDHLGDIGELLVVGMQQTVKQLLVVDRDDGWIEMDTITHIPPPIPEPEPDYTPADLLNLGRFIEAAGIWEIQKSSNQKNYTVKLLVACQTGSVTEAYRALNQPDDFFILPRYVQGNECFTICCGVFTSKRDAKNRLKAVPEWFSSNGGKPVITTIAKLY